MPFWNNTVQDIHTHQLFSGSIYSYSVTGPTVIIRQGANVVLGKGANVIIKGGLEIEGGANVQVEGQITLLERAPEEVITAAKLQLQKPCNDLT